MTAYHLLKNCMPALEVDIVEDLQCIKIAVTWSATFPRRVFICNLNGRQPF
jgi:hypothetical protein